MNGDATTGIVGEHRSALLAQRSIFEADVALAALLLYATYPSAPPWRRGRSLASTFPVGLRLECGQATRDVDVVRLREGSYDVSEDGVSHSFEIKELTGDGVRLRRNGVLESVNYLREDDWLRISRSGSTMSVRDRSLAPARTASTASRSGEVRAAMSGRVVALLIKAGDTVFTGQPLMTLEAMKMERVHRAHVAGTVLAVGVAEGDQVASGRLVIETSADAQSPMGVILDDKGAPGRAGSSHAAECHRFWAAPRDRGAIGRILIRIAV